MIVQYLNHGTPYIDTSSDSVLYAHDPAISGFFGVYFEGVTTLDSRIWSSELNTYAQNTIHDIRNPKVVHESLIAYCQSAEVPEITLKTLTLETVQYNHISLPATLDYGGQTTTFRFIDTSLGLLIRFFRNWVFCLRRPDKSFPKKSDRKLLKCNAILFATDPTFSEVTFACGFLGLMPTNIPTQSYSQDINTKNFITVNQSFKYDKLVIDDHLFDYAYKNLLPLFASHDGVVQWQLR